MNNETQPKLAFTKQRSYSYRLRSGSAVSALSCHSILILRLINDKDRLTQ